MKQPTLKELEDMFAEIEDEPTVLNTWKRIVRIDYHISVKPMENNK